MRGSRTGERSRCQRFERAYRAHVGDPTGACVERLSIPEAYRIARALRFVGFILDQEQQRIEIGERAHRLLRERSQMQANADRPYSAEHVADDFLDAYGRRLSKDAGWLRDRILTYVDTKVAFRRADENVADLGAGAVAARRRDRRLQPPNRGDAHEHVGARRAGVPRLGTALQRPRTFFLDDDA